MRIYGDRSVSYAYMDTGHACRNIHFQAAALRLGTVVVGAFRDADVRRLLSMPENEHPLALLPVGKI